MTISCATNDNEWEQITKNGSTTKNESEQVK